MTERTLEPGGPPNDLVAEHVDLSAADGACAALEAALAAAEPVFRAAPGCRGFRVARSLDRPGHYRLTVWWETLAAHTVDFRSSAAFTRWRELVTPHLTQPPRAEHFVDHPLGA